VGERGDGHGSERASSVGASGDGSERASSVGGSGGGDGSERASGVGGSGGGHGSERVSSVGGSGGGAGSERVSSVGASGDGAGATLEVDLRVERSRGDEGHFALAAAFSAPPGITILFGPSGSGKSTTLGAIAGLVTPTAGRIALGGEVWFDGARGVSQPVERRGLAYVFQSLALFPHMTALENVAYGIDRAVPAAERRARAAAMLARMRVAHLGERRPRTFSGGEAQRVALARAFARRPRVVLLDEPFSALDRELRRDFVDDVRAYIAEARVPMLHVTHHRNEARALGDRVVLLDGGRVRAQGGIDELLPPSGDKMDDSLPHNLRR
jgi:molybdate transport system ATP-binding protein